MQANQWGGEEGVVVARDVDVGNKIVFIDLCGVSGVVLGASSARRELLNVCFFHFVVDHSTLFQF